MNHIPDNGYETNNRKDDPKCIHGIGMYLRCARCADEANQRQTAGIAQADAHAINCPCDQCRPDLAAKRSNQAFHAELVKLNRNVEGLTGVAATLAEETRAMNRHIETDKWHKRRDEMAKKVEPKKAEGSNEGGLGSFSSESLRKELWRRNGEVVPQPHAMLCGPVRDEEVDEAQAYWVAICSNRAAVFTPGVAIWRHMLENFARSRGLMP